VIAIIVAVGVVAVLMRRARSDTPPDTMPSQNLEWDDQLGPTHFYPSVST
jgi:hypothetical protein